ncbi:MAG: D-aminoacyl-tRNA deacylase [Candidatus Poseidoniaceae archaeon]|jgi:D-aminoacyl-tRNA deacylase|nr:D-aminoacyl-tRNA deacylase [Candidatus Poseidoniaceae archaeon]
MVSLIIVSGGDIASYNQANFLLEMAPWTELQTVEGSRAYSYMHARIWWMPDGVLWEDNLDKRWNKATGEMPTEVIFPSRHSAASGKPSLTLHPIGTMQVPTDEVPKFGGKSSACPPPNPRLAPWWRELNRVAGKLDEFELSLETTHHGPWLETPSLFIEIGSTDATWGHEIAAQVLAGIIFRGLGLDGSTGIGGWENKGKVLITLGGGHYAPRANKICLADDIWLGHMLATYALPFTKDEDGNIGGMWENSIREAVKSTKAAFPGGEIISSMEKKAFKGWQRQAIRDLMFELGIPIMRTAQIIG